MQNEADQVCYPAQSGTFIDWYSMAEHGLIQMTSCDTKESLTDL